MELEKKLSISGSYRARSGTFEFIKDPNGDNHRFF